MASSRVTVSISVVVDTEIDSTTWVINRLIMVKPYQDWRNQWTRMTACAASYAVAHASVQPSMPWPVLTNSPLDRVCPTQG
jgi:hypothetical protein